MASDVRVRYTKMFIKQSLTELLKTKPLKKITVKEICEKAEINRATFYKHYLDVYDLLDQIENQLIEELKQALKAEHNRQPKVIFNLIMSSLQKDSETYKALFSEHGDPEFRLRILEKSWSLIDKNFIKNSIGHIPEERQEYVYRYMAHGCYGIINQWLIKGMTDPIEEISDMAEKLITNAKSIVL